MRPLLIKCVYNPLVIPCEPVSLRFVDRAEHLFEICNILIKNRFGSSRVFNIARCYHDGKDRHCLSAIFIIAVIAWSKRVGFGFIFCLQAKVPCGTMQTRDARITNASFEYRSTPCMGNLFGATKHTDQAILSWTHSADGIHLETCSGWNRMHKKMCADTGSVLCKLIISENWEMLSVVEGRKRKLLMRSREYMDGVSGTCAREMRVFLEKGRFPWKWIDERGTIPILLTHFFCQMSPCAYVIFFCCAPASNAINGSRSPLQPAVYGK